MQIGFIGFRIMGQPMSKNVIKAPHAARERSQS